MIDPSRRFLEGLNQQGHVALFEKVQGRLRLDLTEGDAADSWLIAIDKGDVHVSQVPADTEADCVIRTQRWFFDQLANGEANALSALLRGLIQVEGDLALALSLGRLIPGPPHSRWRGHRRVSAGRRRAA